MSRQRTHAGGKQLVIFTVLILVVAVGAVVFSVRGLWMDKSVPPSGGGQTEQPGQTGQEGPTTPTEEETDTARTELLAQADKLSASYFYDEALQLLREKPELSDDSVAAKIDEIQKLKDSLVKYEGEIHHVFFHSLIVYPELAFDNKGHPAEGYNMWMTTVYEFQRMLPQFLERGYVLYDIEETAEYNEAEGKWQRKDIYLPEGKKPLIISQDDVNYYDYMKPDGFANRLVIADDGRVATEVITPEGQTIVTRDGDVLPILDDFVEAHPEFSYRGAKGILAVTGYQGAFGYRTTDPDLYTAEEDAQFHEEAKRVADAVKASGWKLASHSYTHNGYFRELTVTMDQMKYDTDRWRRDIGITTGDTQIYISPFGYRMENDDPRYRYLVEQGKFHLFCFVGSGQTIYYHEDNVIMPRFNLDGFQMNKHPEYIEKYYFNVAEVYDPARPPLNLP